MTIQIYPLHGKMTQTIKFAYLNLTSENIFFERKKIIYILKLLPRASGLRAEYYFKIVRNITSKYLFFWKNKTDSLGKGNKNTTQQYYEQRKINKMGSKVEDRSTVSLK